MKRLLSPFILCCLLANAAGQEQGRSWDPRLGYVYPAGGRAGTTLEVMAGGQNLKKAQDVRISGEGVQARIIKTYRPVRNLDGDQRALLRWHVACRSAQLHNRQAPAKPKPETLVEDGKTPGEITLPEMPFLDLLPGLDEQGIGHWLAFNQGLDRMQPSPQLGEIARITITIAPDAAPGLRELRIGGPQGLSAPLRFEIGHLAEVRECEPNETAEKIGPGETSSKLVATIPCVFNGQIQSGDVDSFRFRARKGTFLVVRGQARALIPYLADAVPGWFQMVVAVRDAKGKELAYGDDFRFDPDPLVGLKIPEDGEYTVEIRDSIYRGREDFVYRVHVGELRVLASIFPLGGQTGHPLSVDTRGWNLPVGKVELDTTPGGSRVRRVPAHKLGTWNTIAYAVDDLPEAQEVEPNQERPQANEVGFPAIFNGKIGQPGDLDFFRVEGEKDQEFVIEIMARRLGSPLDAVLHIQDANGKVLAWNDDVMEKDGHLHLGDGMSTHHADPALHLKAPRDGPVFVRVADTQAHGGPDYAYRLRIDHVRPDFELRVTPSALNVPAGGRVPVRVHVARGPGFDGEINLAIEDAPPGYTLQGAKIPAGESAAQFTLLVTAGSRPGVLPLRLVGHATAGGGSISREAQAVDDSMQAFLWRHLVPASEWLICVPPGKGKRPPLASRP